MPNDFVIIKDALSRIERDKQNSWTEYVELIGTINDLETENANLSKVADAARGVFLGEGEYLCSEFKNDIDRLRQALAELDKEES